MAQVQSPDPNHTDGEVAKAILNMQQTGDNLLQSDAWWGWQKGFERQDAVWVCDNGADTQVERGAGQTIPLNQEKPGPFVASAWSRAGSVGGNPDLDYSLYLDLHYQDGTTLWAQTASFSVGTHDWERREIIIYP